TLPAHGSVTLASLALGDTRLASRGSIDASYREALFSADYGRAYYQGFVDSIGAVGVRFAAADAPAGDRHTAPPTKRRVAIAGGVITGGLAITAIATGAIALQAKHEYDTTDLQRPAEEARRRYERYGTVALVSGAAALVCGGVSYYL